VVWSTVAGAQGGTVGGYTAQDFAAYFIITMLVNHLTFTWVMHEFEFMIRMGHLSPLLLRPVHPIHVHLADNVTYKLLTSLVIVPAAFGLAALFHPHFATQPWAALLAIPALALSFLTRFMLGWTLALAAFWTTRVFAINEMYFLASFFLSGQMAPLALFPGAVQTAAAFLPFRWVVAFPTELILGRLTLTEALMGLGIEAIWLGLSYLLMTYIWAEGMKRFSAVGA
jgi:ABC-2 type transport system permease protein